MVTQEKKVLYGGQMVLKSSANTKSIVRRGFSNVATMNGTHCQSRDPEFRVNFIRMTIFYTSRELELNVS